MNDLSRPTAFVDGRLVPITEAKISLLDWGFLHSDATYDVVHVWKGKFFRIQDHLERFFSSMKKLHLTIAYSPKQLEGILVDCVCESRLRDAYVEMICTRGVPEPGSRDPRTCTNNFFAFILPFVWIASPEKQKQGLHLIVSNRQRIGPESIDPTIKNYHWLDMVMGLFDAYDDGGETVILIDAQGHLVEGPGFNIFGVKKQIITTPERGILQGITRRTAIELAKKYGYEMIQDRLPADQARLADEIFITSTAGGIIPVTKIDAETVGSGKPGPVTLKLQKGYWAMHEDPRYAQSIEYKPAE